MALTCLSLGCSGFIQGGDSDDDGEPSGPGPGDGPVEGGPGGGNPLAPPTANPDGTASGDATVGRMPLRRLGKVELENTLRDLLTGLPADYDGSVDLPADNGIELAFAVPGTVSDLEVRAFMDLAEAAVAALSDAGPGQSFSCDGADESACARAFVEGFGKRAFRRPLEAVEIDDLMALYDALRVDAEMQYGFQDALSVLVEAMLQSPGFLYHWERGLKAPQLDGALMGQLGLLIDKLSGVPEGDGTMFDNTIVMFMNTLNSGYSHTVLNVPTIVAAGANTGIRTGGRVMDLGSEAHNKLLAALSNHVGVPMDSWGDARYSGTLDLT